MSRKIYKHIVQVVILSPESTIEKSLGEDWGLEEVACAINDGDCIGQVSHTSTKVVPADKVKAELQAIDNDGTFFDSEEDEDKPFMHKGLRKLLAKINADTYALVIEPTMEGLDLQMTLLGE